MKKVQHLALSFHNTTFECFNTVFTFNVAISIGSFFPLMGGMDSHCHGITLAKKVQEALNSLTFTLKP